MWRIKYHDKNTGYDYTLRVENPVQVYNIINNIGNSDFIFDEVIEI